MISMYHSDKIKIMTKKGKGKKKNKPTCMLDYNQYMGEGKALNQRTSSYSHIYKKENT
jgi:hypothetical protein